MSLRIEQSVNIARQLRVEMEVQMAVIDKPVPVEQLTVAPSTATVEYYPSSGNYFDKVTANAVTSEIDGNIQPLNIRQGVTILGVEGNLEPDKPDQSKTVYPSTEQQVVVADTGFELAEVIVEPMILQEKIVEPTVGGQDIVADIGYDALSKVTLEPLALQSKEVTPTELTQNVTADSGYVGLSGVQVNPIPNEYVDTSGGTITPSTVASGYIGYSQGSEVIGTATLAEDTCCGEFEARYCFFNKYGRYQIVSKQANILGTFEKPTTVGDVPENVGYNPALIFQGWNFDDSELTNVTGDLDIGAIYIPADGKTHIYIDIENNTILDYTFNLTVSNIGTGTFYFDFGDGSMVYTATTNGLKTIAHSYLAKGSYHITTWLEGADSNGEIVLGTASTFASAFVGDYYSSVHNNTIKRIYFGIDIRWFSQNAGIPQLRACEVLSLHNAVRGINIDRYYNLHYLILPKTATAGTFNPQRASFEFLSMPLNITSFFSGQNTFSTTRVDKLISASTGITGISSSYSTQYFMRSINLTGATSFNLYNTNAETVSLPSSLTALSNQGSVNREVSIKIIVMRATTPPTLSDSLGYYCKIYVPQASLSTYQSATNWSNYASQMVGY